MITWLLIGAGLGLALEGAGFGSPRKLTGVFVLRDAAVVQVMATAIVTAVAGLLVLDLVGVDTGVFVPPTRYLAQAVGGLLFGVGFFVGGYCPGTSVVGAASGRTDALGFMAGMIGGWYVWDGIREQAGSIVRNAPRSLDTLPEILGMDPRLLSAIVVLVGGAALYLSWRLWRREPAPPTATESRRAA